MTAKAKARPAEERQGADAGRCAAAPGAIPALPTKAPAAGANSAAAAAAGLGAPSQGTAAAGAAAAAAAVAPSAADPAASNKPKAKKPKKKKPALEAARSAFDVLGSLGDEDS